MSDEITKFEDVIDSRDIINRITDLESYVEYGNATDEEKGELTTLKARVDSYLSERRHLMQERDTLEENPWAPWERG